MKLSKQNSSFGFIKWITYMIISLFIILCFIIYQTEKDNQIMAMERLGQQATEHTAAMLETWINEQINTVKLIAADKRVINACKNPSDVQAVAEATELLEAVHDNYPHFENLPLASKLKPGETIIINVNGEDKIIGDGQFITDTVNGVTIGKCGPHYSYISEIYNGKDYFISEVYKSIFRENPIFVISTPVKDETGKLVGVAIISPQMNYFTDTFVETVKVGKTGYLFFMDDRSVMISHPDKSLILNKKGAGELKDVSNKIFNKSKSIFKANFRNIKKRYIYKQIDIPKDNIIYNWYIVFTQSDKEIIAPSIKFLQIIFVLGIIFVTLYVVAMLFMYQVVTQRTTELINSNKQLKLEVEERKKMQVKMEVAKEEAEKANLAKSEFLANMSHEIRTPLNSVIGFAELLASIASDEKIESYVNSIKSSGKALLTLINDILDLSKIEAGKVKLQYTSVNIRMICREIEDIFKQDISRKMLSYVTQVDPNIPKFLALDEMRFRQILLNLIGNAIKFTEKGHVKVIISYESNNNNFLDLIISIEDTGIGISKESQEHIFEAFKQQDGQSNRKFRGTGLGLTISKKLVTAMKGNLSVESEVSKGSKFTVTLKNVKKATKSISLDDENKLNINNIIFESAKVLVVDDYISNLDLLDEILKKVNLDVFIASSGEDAIAIANELIPDIILMDIMMPQINGIEATKKIRANPKLKAVPIIALSATSQFLQKNDASHNVFDGFLTKPINLHLLFNEIGSYIDFETYETTSIDEKKFIIEDISKHNELIDILTNKILTEMPDLTKVIKMTEIESFGINISKLGSDFNIKYLTNQGKRLQRFAKEFDIENIDKLLKDFEENLDKLNKTK